MTVSVTALNLRAQESVEQRVAEAPSNLLERLPNDMKTEIFSHLNIEDMSITARVSRGWKRLTDKFGNDVFKRSVASRFPEDYQYLQVIPRDTWKEVYHSLNGFQPADHAAFVERAKQVEESSQEAINASLISILFSLSAIFVSVFDVRPKWIADYMQKHPGISIREAIWGAMLEHRNNMNRIFR